ncbi:MAG: SGNH/GDSL hydrolase family protein [Mycobacterium sp.]|nr:SGNH/GDSL hydrolase family protein [Mycobacterium sp.]
MNRYVALGSSMAAGPGIAPRATGSPRRAMRSERNYPHLVAARLGLDLIDVTYSGATTAHILRQPQHGSAPQIDALDGSERLVTITIGGNDVGYVPLLFAATLPAILRRVPVIGPALRVLLDPAAREWALNEVATSLNEVGAAVRGRCPRARVMFVDYLTLLPPAGIPAPPLSEPIADLARHVAARLEDLTATAARETGCEIVAASHASRDHHAWSGAPWTIGAGPFLPGRPKPFHPNAEGMSAVADLVVARVGGRGTGEGDGH